MRGSLVGALAGLVLGLLAMLATPAGAMPSSVTGPSASARARTRTPTAWTQVQTQASDERHGVTADTALHAFAVELGSIPGAHARNPSGTPPDATDAVQWVVGNVRRLTPAQRRAVSRILIGRTTFRKSAARSAAVGGITAAERSVVKRATDYMAPRLGINNPLPEVLTVGNARKGVEAWTSPPLPQPYSTLLGLPTKTCVTALTPLTLGYGTADRDYVIAHEVFHCLMWQKLLGVVTAPAAFVVYKRFTQPWVGEGGPTYAGCKYMMDVEHASPQTTIDHYAQYLTQPLLPLNGRDDGYDGVGFFALLGHAGIDPFGRFALMYVAPTTPLAYAAAVAGAESTVEDDWAAAYFRTSEPDSDWDAPDPCAPKPDVRAQPENMIVQTGQSTPFIAAAYTVHPYLIDSSADVIRVTSQGGDVRIGSPAGTDAKHVTDEYFCTKQGGCSCPGPNGVPLQPLPPSQPIMLAVTGGTGGSTGSVEGMPDCHGVTATYAGKVISLTDTYFVFSNVLNKVTQGTVTETLKLIGASR